MKNFVTIGHILTIEFRTFGAIYAGVFAALWTFIEPLGLFGIIGSENNIGFLGYVLLLLFSLFASILPTKIYRIWLFERQEFLHIIFESSSDGRNHKIKTPKNIQVWDFTNLVLDYLAKGEAKERVISTRHYFEPVLYLKKKDKEKIELDNSKTLIESQVEDGDHIIIVGKPKKQKILYSRRCD